MTETVVLVDEHDAQVGTAEKLAAHRGEGRLHRAVSVFVFDRAGRVLLQRRAAAKHHFRRRWANTCCTHPRPGEDPVAAGERRLQEEMGLSVTLRPAGSFVYRAVDPESGLVEHEFDHVLVGESDADPTPDPAEADGWQRLGLDVLEARLRGEPETFVPWLAEALACARIAAR